uniref:ABC transporter permease n=1 Tax=candidate division WOR-3 bacterium TaxID=2052148 RepID=A0A7C2P1G5_UNCW3
MDIKKLALRNLMRNKRRSFLTALSLFVSGFVIVALHGYLKGALNASRELIIKLDTGHVLITTKDYFERRIFLPQEEYIEELDEVIRLLENSKYVDFYTFRIKAGGMVFTKNGINKTGYLFAIDPEKESKTFELKKKIVEGTSDLEKGCVIASDLARTLKLKPGDTLTILTRSVSGGLSAVKLPVSGIASIGYATLDRSLIILSFQHAKKLLKMGDGTHEILVFLKKEKDINRFIKSLHLPEELTANPYTFTLGGFAFFYKFADVFYLSIYILITLLAAFAIVNTMTVAVFERMREIGTLKALGMTDNEIFKLFGLEGTIIGSTGGLAGGLVGLLTNAILHAKGMNFESLIKGIEFPLPYIIRPSVNLWILVLAFIIVTSMSFLASIFPALRAKKLTPQDTLRSI